MAHEFPKSAKTFARPQPAPAPQRLCCLPPVSRASDPEIRNDVACTGGEPRWHPTKDHRILIPVQEPSMEGGNMFGILEMLVCLSPITLLAAVGAMVLVVQLQRH
jgi:hypothetical protein